MAQNGRIEGYWCHFCNQSVTVDINMFCTRCNSGFVQAIGMMHRVTDGSNVQAIYPAGHERNRLSRRNCRCGRDQCRLEWYNRQFIQLVKCCIRTGQPNPSSRDVEFDMASASAEVEEEVNFHLGSLYNENSPATSFENDNNPLIIPQNILQQRPEGETSEEEQANRGHNDESDGNISVRNVVLEDDIVGVVLDGWRCFGMYGEDGSNDMNNEDTLLNSGQEENPSRPSDIVNLHIDVAYCECDTGYAELDILSIDLDWHALLKGLEDNTIEINWAFFDHSKGEGDSDHHEEYDVFDVGNPHDYVNDEAEYQRILQQLLENDDPNTRGPPPASKAAIVGLPTIVICEEHVDSGLALCSICKEIVCVGEPAKQMPCLHLFHEDCITSWLGRRNSCPICRLELPTDDVDYEVQKRKRTKETTTD